MYICTILLRVRFRVWGLGLGFIGLGFGAEGSGGGGRSQLHSDRTWQQRFRCKKHPRSPSRKSNPEPGTLGNLEISRMYVTPKLHNKPDACIQLRQGQRQCLKTTKAPNKCLKDLKPKRPVVSGVIGVFGVLGLGFSNFGFRALGLLGVFGSG